MSLFGLSKTALLFCLGLSVSCGGGNSPLRPPIPFGPPRTDFMVVVWPDTQSLVEYGQDDIFYDMAHWACDYRFEHNIKAVVGLGDMVNHPTDEQFQVADKAYEILDNCDMPYAPTVGNHEYDPPHTQIGPNGRPLATYNRYFPASRISAQPWFVGHFEDNLANHAIRFTSGSHTIIVISLELYPRTVALDWAQTVINSNPNAQFIVATHAHINRDSEWSQSDEQFGSELFGLEGDNAGVDLWHKFLRINPRIVAVVNGHFIPFDLPNQGRRTDAAIDGSPIHQMMSNYQVIDAEGNRFNPDGTCCLPTETLHGNGRMRLLRFLPDQDVVAVSTYSAESDRFDTDPNNQFTLSLEAN